LRLPPFGTSWSASGHAPPSKRHTSLPRPPTPPACLPLVRVAELATRHGLADGAEWMRNWEQEWQVPGVAKTPTPAACLLAF
jgi:hypothetical protein